MTSPLFRGDTETKQILGKKAAFTRTLSSNNSEVVLDLAGKMQEGTKISIIVEQADAYINFDGTATKVASGDGTIHSILIPAGQGYSEENIFISSNITAINATAGSNARIRGFIWGR